MMKDSKESRVPKYDNGEGRRALELYAKSSNPSLDQAYAACEAMAFLIRESGGRSDSTLRASAEMAERLLASYGTLQATGEAMSAFTVKGEKLPQALVSVFANACLISHPSLNTLLNEIWSVYGGEDIEDERGAVRRVILNRPANADNKPVLWSGVRPNYNPAAFYLTNQRRFDAELYKIFSDGADRIAGVMANYPCMDKVSQDMLDERLANLVSIHWLDNEDPIRTLLAEKINPVQEAVFRIENLFLSDWSNDRDCEFMIKLEKTFDQIGSFPPDDKQTCLEVLADKLVFYLTNESQTSLEDYPLQACQAVIKRAGELGFDALEATRASIPGMEEDFYLMTLLESKGVAPRDHTSSTAWMQAIALSVDPSKAIELDVGLDNLAWIFSHTRSGKIRGELMKTSEGRDKLFSVDLGL